MKTKITLIILLTSMMSFSQSDVSKILYEIAEAPSAIRIENDIRTLVGFGTRHTLSDTISNIRGIVSFIEEAIPGLDFFPPFTLTWLYVYVLKKDKVIL